MLSSSSRSGFVKRAEPYSDQSPEDADQTRHAKDDGEPPRQLPCHANTSFPRLIIAAIDV
jgi:hypothetical protein